MGNICAAYATITTTHLTRRCMHPHGKWSSWIDLWGRIYQKFLCWFGKCRWLVVWRLMIFHVPFTLGNECIGTLMVSIQPSTCDPTCFGKDGNGKLYWVFFPWATCTQPLLAILRQTIRKRWPPQRFSSELFHKVHEKKTSRTYLVPTARSRRCS